MTNLLNKVRKALSEKREDKRKRDAIDKMAQQVGQTEYYHELRRTRVTQARARARKQAHADARQTGKGTGLLGDLGGGLREFSKNANKMMQTDFSIGGSTRKGKRKKEIWEL